MKIRFHIPDFWKHWELDLNIIDLLRSHPEYFYDDVEIASCFGCFAPALWNGGRAIGGYTGRAQIENTIRRFNERGVPLRFTFTNPTLTAEDLSDPFCNHICKAAQNGFNEIICNDPMLEEYIRSSYPDYPLISSTCKGIRDIDGLVAELEKDYRYVVMDYNFNNDFDALSRIPEDLRSRIEVLINPYCMPNCPRRAEHYRVLGECQRRSSSFSAATAAQLMKSATEFNCPNSGYDFYRISEYPTFVKREYLERYTELGINNFKIEGRTLSLANVLESYVYYMIRPEHRDSVRLRLLTAPPRESLSACRS